MEIKDKKVLIQSFTELINDKHIIDCTIRTTMKEIDITGPSDHVLKFKAGERTVDIRVVYD